MLYKKNKPFYFLVSIVFLLIVSVRAETILDRCQSITPQERILAQSAGVDVDEECRKLIGIQQQGPTSSRNPLIGERSVDSSKGFMYQAFDREQTGYLGQSSKITTQYKDQVNEELNGVFGELIPFGYHIFSGEPTTFVNSSQAPVPGHYIVGPGDVLKVFLYGKTNREYTLPIGREGTIIFPGLGPIALVGLSFKQTRSLLQNKINEQLIGVESNITLSELRSIQIFVFGEAYKPGSFTVSALSNITNGIISSGGINKYASLRNIALKRNNKIISVLDLYELILKGDTSKDKRLEDGDVIFIPPVGAQVGIDGAVVRPAIYELKSEKTLAQVMQLSGGITANAYAESIKITSNSSDGFTSAREVNFDTKSGKRAKINASDFIKVAKIIDQELDTVTISGHIYRKRGIAFSSNMYVSDLLQKEKAYPPNLNSDFAILLRHKGPAKQLQILPVTLTHLWESKHIKDVKDILLQSSDELVLLNHKKDKSKSFGKFTDRLRFSSSSRSVDPILTISGEVEFPGTYPYIQDISILDLIENFARLTASAYLKSVIILRRHSRKDRIEVLSVDLQKIYAGGADAVTLLPSDQIFILSRDHRNELAKITDQLYKESEIDRPIRVVTVFGEVPYPGVYPWVNNMSVRGLIELAGGLSNSAYLTKGQLVRIDVDEQQKIVKREFSLQFSQSADLSKIIHERDTLFIRKIPEYDKNITVTINGEVKFPGEYVLFEGNSLFHLLLKAGGFTKDGDLRALIIKRVSLQQKSEEIEVKLKQDIEKDIQLRKLDFNTQEDRDAISDIVNLDAESEEFGRIVVNLPKILAEYKALGISTLKELEQYKRKKPQFITSQSDLLLLNEDQVIVPQKRSEIFVIGEIHRSTSHLFNKKLSHKKYIRLSGGFRKEADKVSSYVIRVDGSTELLYRRTIFGLQSRRVVVKAGDIIVVPLNTNKRDKLVYLTSLTTVLYQFLISIVALRNLGL